MKTRFILYATGGLFLAGDAAHAGSRGSGSGTSAIAIPADTVNGGGGTSTAGSGASAITVTASIGGIGGTVAAASPATSNRQGYIPQILPAATTPLTGYNLWVSQNIPAGRDASFAGDWNGDGIPNGIAYVFGNTGVTASGKGRIPVPPATPPDVTIDLYYSGSLASWQRLVTWPNGGAAQMLVGGILMEGGEVREREPQPRGYFRYKVTKN